MSDTGKLISLVAAALLCGAAAGVPERPGAEVVAEWDGRLLLLTDERSWLDSADAGLTWRPADPPPGPGADAAPRHAGCVPGEPWHCYRVVPGRLAVQETADGGRSWETAWERADASPDGASTSVVVRAVEDGHVVVVANGRDGYARRDAGGRWERRDVPPYRGAPRPLDALALGLALGGALGALVFLAGGTVAARRRRDRAHVAGFVLLALPGTLAAALLLAPGGRAGAGAMAATAAGTAALCACVGLLVVRAAPGYRGALAPRAGRATAAVATVPFLAAAAGAPIPYPLVVVTALAAGVGGLLVAIRQSSSASGRPSKSTAEYTASFSSRW